MGYYPESDYRGSVGIGRGAGGKRDDVVKKTAQSKFMIELKELEKQFLHFFITTLTIIML